MLFTGQRNNTDIQNLEIKIDGKLVEQIGNNCKFVGQVLDKNLTWDGHIEHVSKILASANFAINSSKNFLHKKIRKTIYYSLFDSHLNFGNLLWGCASNKLIKKLDNLQKRCIRNVEIKKYKAHTEPLFKHLEILKLSDKLSFCQAQFMHQYRNKKLPESFDNMFSEITVADELQTKHNDYNYINHPAIKNSLERFPTKMLVSNWNHLNVDLKSTADYLKLKFLLKKKILSSYIYETDCYCEC